MSGARCRRTRRVGGMRGKFSVGHRLLLGLRGFLDAVDILIGNFPAEVTALAALLDVLLEENGASGIGGKQARGRQEDITHTILHGDRPTKELRIRRHSSESVMG